MLVHNVLTGLKSLQRNGTPTCAKYKVDIAPKGYLLSAKMAPSFEISLEDILYIKSISPSRIEEVSLVHRDETELVIMILDGKQHIMVVSTTSFWMMGGTRKRKFAEVVQ
jgi:hypothetical protein